MQNNQALPRRRTVVIASVLVAAAITLGLASMLVTRNDGLSGTGKALIGGPFTMVNQDGATVTEKSFAGKYMLVFFGYTYCPDVCPTSLQVMGKALDRLGPKAGQLVPVFVSIDPERDDVAIMKTYVDAVDPRITGLTGTKEQVAGIAAAFRVFYAKVENSDRPADYLMDHSSLLYLMGPDGDFLKHFNYDVTSESLARSLGTLLP